MDAERLIEQIAEQQGVDYKTASALIASLLESIAEQLAAGERICFEGFGEFAIKRIPPWLGPHPDTREMVTLPGRNVPYFQSDPALRKRMNDGVDWKHTMPRPIKKK
ncbi:putative histone family protein DNA-binding protein [Magnetofaba australis IT-1]|uniref:Putative histone family protein DNA-binding protein n=1 Tax=Magnetofaba australis IT-1 TaxID=1434232 RepID=A0A1Y2K6T9_9PROT|nr:HU family DNA-binding protein [Magnetofaba australis]OSM05349.1 putative histone family protein DNA-binding protein [Magnetofaba australis IT-1]